MSKLKLRLYMDRLSPGASSVPLRQTNRAIYACEGTAVLRGADVAVSFASNCAWQSYTAVAMSAGPEGAKLLRWELSRTDPSLLQGEGLTSELVLEGEPRIEHDVDYLMRCDRVDFPPGGVALTHTHQGSGIRFLLNGRIRVETEGHDFWVEPGGAWFESGSDPVFAETRADGPTHFVRVMILPRALQGKSSIRYVRPEDQGRPKNQKYQVLIDEPIDLQIDA